MELDYQNIIFSIISLILGGGGVWLFTIKSTKEKARAEAMKEVQDVYQETISDLREDKRLLKEDNSTYVSEMKSQKEKYSELEKIVEQNTKDIKNLVNKNMREKCLNFSCKERVIG